MSKRLLNYSQRTDVSSRIELLSNQNNLYTKYYRKAQTKGQQYLKPLEITPPTTENATELVEYFIALTDTYHYDLTRAAYSHSMQQLWINMAEAKHVLKKLISNNDADYLLARLVILMLGLTVQGAAISPRELKYYTHQIKDKTLKSTLNDELAVIRKGESAHTQTLQTVKRESSSNRKRLLRQLQHDGVLKAISPLASSEYELALFVPATVLPLILATKRLKSAWEVPVSRYPGYYALRDYTERKLGIRGMGSLNHPHPIYGLLLSQSEYRNAYYGEVKVILKPHVAERTIFSLGDSFEPYNHFLMTIQDALFVAQQQRDQRSSRRTFYITRGQEIEAKILGGVTVDDIDHIEEYSAVLKSS